MKPLHPIVALVLFASLLSSQTKRDGITIPLNGSHPFTYWNSARRTAAAAWASKVGYVPVTNLTEPMDPTDAAFACYVLNNAKACSAVINWAMSKSTGNCNVVDDPLRWVGGSIGEIYDWDYSALTAAQRSSLNKTWVSCQHEQDNNSGKWGLYGANGTPSMPANNYFHGNLRNDILFGVSMFYDNANAPAQMLDVGIGAIGGAANGSRLNALENYSQPGGAGYAFPFTESPGQYVRYADYYASIWIPALHLLGRDINQETTAYKASVLVNIYNSIYSNAYRGCQEYISWDDDEYWSYGCKPGNVSAHNGYANYNSWTPDKGDALMTAQYFGDFMQMMVNEQSQTNIGRYARQWLNTVKPSVGPVFAALDANPAPLSFSNLPLDYCASSGVCWSNSIDWFTTGSERAWFAGNTMRPGGNGHGHAETGNFQVWRKGIPIVRETVGYAQKIAGYGGQGLVSIASGFAHNVLLINHHGSNVEDDLSVQGTARILRRETQSGYFYEASDLTLVYNTAGQPHSNTAVSDYVREFFNFRNIPAILTVDRATAKSSTIPITYLGHCETKPIVTTGGSYTYVDCTDKGQRARWTFLRPTHPRITIVDESTNGASCTNCQFRIEAENTTPDNTLSYFVVLVQVGDSGSFAALSPGLVDSQPSDPSVGTFTVSLDSQDGLVLQKGPTSNGGTITVAGAKNALGSGVEQMSVTDSGPVWSSGSGPTMTSVVVNPPSSTISVGVGQQYTATCIYADNTSSNCTGAVSWSSSNPPVATIAAGGLLNPVAVGTTTVSATLDDAIGTAGVTVTNPVLTNIQVAPSTASIAGGTGTESYSAICTYSNQTTSNCTSKVTWTSSNTSTATISSNGMTVGRAAGTVIISASSGSITGTSTLTVTAGQWTLKQGGSDASKQTGLYGSLGTAAPGNIPGGRQAAATWTDSNGNFWLFGGNGVDSTGAEGYLDDLWEYLSSKNDWAWIGGTKTASGSSSPNGSVASPPNFPGARAESTSWVSAGFLWLFGGDGYDSAGLNGSLNDLWKFNPSSGKWTQVSGSDKVPAAHKGQAGIYGDLKVPARANTPGGRWGANSWTDSAGNLWLFGGVGTDSAGSSGSLNDLWKFDPSMSEWTWISGSNMVGPRGGQTGEYGTLGIPSLANVPSGRSQGMSWTDSKGELWLFGGYGYDSAGNLGYLNDLWEFDPLSKEWKWMGGNNTVGCNGCGRSGIYGNIGVADSRNVPGGRMLAVTWIDSNGNFWLFGGEGYDASGKLGELNDLWEFDSSSDEWIWMGGGSSDASTNQTATVPEARSGAVGWRRNLGNLWLFGGLGLNSNQSYGVLNDLWQYQPPKN